MGEPYLRLPLVAREAASPTAATWRFRILVIVVLLAVAVGVVALVRALTSAGGEANPGVHGQRGATGPAMPGPSSPRDVPA